MTLFESSTTSFQADDTHLCHSNNLVLQDNEQYDPMQLETPFIFHDLSQLYQNSISEKISVPHSRVIADHNGQPFSNITTFGDEWLNYPYAPMHQGSNIYECWPYEPSGYAEYAPMTRELYCVQDIHDQDYVRVDHTYRDYSCVSPSEEDRKRFLNKKKEYEKKNSRVKKDKLVSGKDEVDKENKEVKGRSKSKASREDDDDVAYGFMGTNFPARLHDLLTFDEGISDIITWLPHGRAWIVLKKPEFVAKVAPSHFSISKFESFTRQVNGWGFKRITQGPDINAYYHEMFLRGMPHLIQWMKRNTTTQGRRKVRADPRDEPNFYQISSLYPLPDYYSILCSEESSLKIPRNEELKSFQASDGKHQETYKGERIVMEVEKYQDPKQSETKQKKKKWKKQNLRVVTGEDLNTEEGMKRVTQDEGVFRVSPNAANEIPRDTIIKDLVGKKDMKESTIQDALEIWAREQTFSFTTEIEMERDGGVTESCPTKINSPKIITSSRFKCVINHPLALTPLCGPRTNWNDETCDFMPLPFDYDTKMTKEVSFQTNSGNVNIQDNVDPPLNYYTDQELYLCPAEGPNPYEQHFFSKESSLFQKDVGYYGPFLSSESMDHEGALATFDLP